jgi:hypothetical protein
VVGEEGEGEGEGLFIIKSVVVVVQLMIDD